MISGLWTEELAAGIGGFLSRNFPSVFGMFSETGEGLGLAGSGGASGGTIIDVGAGGGGSETAIDEASAGLSDGADGAGASGKPEWLARLEAGNDFNAERSAAYLYNEVYIETPNGTGYTRLDSYNPSSGEIVSRKFTQLSSVQEKTAIRYINELPTKYPVNGTVASVPSSGELAGQPLLGQHILEVPVQADPIPRSILDVADRAGVIIRDITGHIY